MSRVRLSDALFLISAAVLLYVLFCGGILGWPVPLWVAWAAVASCGYFWVYGMSAGFKS